VDPYAPDDGNYEVDPRLIRYIYTQDTALLRKFDIGLVMGGDWESNRSEQLLENSDLFKAAYQRFKEGKDWSETEYYSMFIENGMERVTGPRQREKLKRKLKHQLEIREKLYFKMKKEGYLPQNRITEEFPNAKAVQHWGEIAIHIGREGELYLCQGRHRITYARLLDLSTVYVNIIVRHSEWVKFKAKVVSYAVSNKGVVESPLHHVDLQYIPSRYRDRRIDLILDSMDCTQGKIVDLNAHWGYFCRRFELLGFDCYAYENDEQNRKFLKKLRQIDNLYFTILSDLSSNIKNDQKSIEALLLMGDWEGLVDNEQMFETLLGFLAGQDIERVFVEIVESGSAPDRITNQEKLIQGLMECGRFNERRMLGETELGTELIQIM